MADSRQGNLVINLITGSRLGLAVGVAVLTLWSGDQLWAILSSIALILAIELSDIADGYLARRHNAVSQFGKVFDPFADSIARLTVYWSLATIGRCLSFLPLAMAVRDISVAYLRIVMIRRGGDASARYTGKLKAVVQGVCALLLMSGPLYWGNAGKYVIYGLSFMVVAVCAASLIDYAHAALWPSRPA